LLNEADHLFGSIVLTQVEMAATFQRAVRMDAASPKLAAEIWQDFLDHWQSFTRLRVFAGTIERASENAWKYDLRGHDSLHLAAALLWQEIKRKKDSWIQIQKTVQCWVLCDRFSLSKA